MAFFINTTFKMYFSNKLEGLRRISIIRTWKRFFKLYADVFKNRWRKGYCLVPPIKEGSTFFFTVLSKKNTQKKIVR